ARPPLAERPPTVSPAVSAVELPVTAPPPTPGSHAASAGPSSDCLDLGTLWRDLLEAVGRASPFARNYLIEAHPVSLAKNVFTIGFDPEFAEHIDLVNNQKTHGLLQTKLGELRHPNVQIKFINAERSVE